MARSLSAYDLPPRLRNLEDRGWCAFEAAFDSAEVGHMLAILHGYIDGLDAARLAGFGATIFALAARDPEMNAIFRRASVLPFVETAMDGSFVFRRTGARISGSTSHDRIVWHHHHGWVEQDLAQRKAFERLHFICYLNGTDRAAGPLIVKPRAFSDRFEAAPEKRFDPLPGEESLEYPAGTIIVMDAPILHSAWRGTGNELRTIWGAHVQSSLIARPHPEDDPPIEKARVRVRHQTFRWGLRDGRRWVDEANRAPLPETGTY